MKKYLVLILAVILSSNILQAQQVFEVDLGKSKVEWLAKKVGGQHNGLVSIQKANITLNSQGEVSQASIVMDMSSITVEDLTGGAKNSLTNHLKNPDFFNTEDYQEASFTVKNGNGELGEVLGLLTIKDISKEYTLQYELKEGEIKGKLVIDRTDFDIMYKSKSILDPKAVADGFIYDDFTITFTLSER
ncbi:MAG TPA: hypothetical protein DCF84_05190 [Bacteroidetes bacterium]|nr:hypothetical protein [Bacteroidota bacterium]|tara:strand:- start:212 stop:778 length:567 start_codon:yes stop_codon:yes gene_type:complete